MAEGERVTLALLDSATLSLNQAPNEIDAVTVASVERALDGVEERTPGGAFVHQQLDGVRKWLRVLEQTDEHGRFGGTTHVRAHVAAQVRLAEAAVEDYFRATK